MARRFDIDSSEDSLDRSATPGSFAGSSRPSTRAIAPVPYEEENGGPESIAKLIADSLPPFQAAPLPSANQRVVASVAPAVMEPPSLPPLPVVRSIPPPAPSRARDRSRSFVGTAARSVMWLLVTLLLVSSLGLLALTALPPPVPTNAASSIDAPPTACQAWRDHAGWQNLEGCLREHWAARE